MIRGYTYVYYTYLYLFEKDMEARAQQSSLGSLTLAAIGVVYGLELPEHVICTFEQALKSFFRDNPKLRLFGEKI